MEIEGNSFSQVEIEVFRKAYSRLASAWGLSEHEASGLLGMPEPVWSGLQEPSDAPSLTEDQLLRLSAALGIYKALELYYAKPLARSWMTRTNAGPLFLGARPVDVAIEGGLKKILEIRKYLDACFAGA
ncbi:hypothetical protein DL1_08325 [Thioclava dalianensis]|uniref:Antitoxin Xre/MbcA/ParS-like toxin-binding domain-containing protein n=1 Tax=Thioclava dalianensis TaxID=1185766 RepID=A0A074TB04_9RHOB|nr:hypothetical protein [Thioclava dalianensis]KEP68864.1 hypothetical protein DL1_08325 [Thioclava dalianensis]SFN22309.1 hypothetical protein SAMN05216224_10322 [Thioclava dalianensis]